MNKNDLKLIIIITLLIIISLIFNFINKEKALNAHVYFDSDLVLTIDLNKDNKYEVDGLLGKVIIEVKNKEIRVVEENSPNHLCSRQGFVSNKGDIIVCLPNKVIVELPNDDIDVEVK